MGNEYSQELIDVAFAALDHGIDSVREGGPLIPFVMSETGSERTLTRYRGRDARGGSRAGDRSRRGEAS